MGKQGNSKIIVGVRKFKQRSQKEFGITRVIIFGSAAKGKMSENSDIDLILVSKKFAGKQFVKRAIGLRKLWDLDYPVDFLCYSPEEFERERKRVSMVREALADGIEV